MRLKTQVEADQKEPTGHTKFGLLSNWQIIHSTKLCILTIFKYTIEQCYTRSRCATTTPSPEHFSFCKSEILYPLPNSPSPHSLSTTLFSTFCLYELDPKPHVYKWNHTVFAFCDWLITRSLMPSECVRVGACGKTSFLSEAERHPLCVCTTFCSPS